MPSRSRVISQKDHAHPAPAELAEDGVGADLSGRCSHRVLSESSGIWRPCGRDRKRNRSEYACSSDCFLGRPRGGMLDSRPSRAMVRCVQVGFPNGLPRATDRRSCSSSSVVSAALTRAVHRAGRSTGQSVSSSRVWAALCRRRHRLDHGHASACFTRLARNGLRSTYRHTVRKCSSVCTGNDSRTAASAPRLDSRRGTTPLPAPAWQSVA